MVHSTLVFSALLVASGALLTSAGPPPTDGTTLQCQTYTGGNTTAATCNDNPNKVCTGGCTGGAVSQGCTLKQGDPPSEQTCTIAWGKSGAALSVCVNEHGSFTCTGTSSGLATCSGCVDKSPNGNNGNNTYPSPDGNNNDHPDTSETSSLRYSFGAGVLATLVYISALLS